MLFIAGANTRQKETGQTVQHCRWCHETTLQKFVEQRVWFTLFFLPIFPVSRLTVFMRCTVCGGISSPGEVPGRMM